MYDNSSLCASFKKENKNYKNTSGKSKILHKKLVKKKSAYKVYIDFHELFTEDIEQFKKYLQHSENRENMSIALNENQENLLHLTCQCNRAYFIKELFKLKCSVCKQDFYGRTPLHVAIQRNHRECIDEFMEILNLMMEDNGKQWQFIKNDNNKKELIENLKNMFTVYDNDGYTVLHLAVIKNQREVVQIMLKFCLKFNINILQYEVLGSGNSILHLAVNRNFKNIESDIIALIKESENYPNYSGSLPYKSIK